MATLKLMFARTERNWIGHPAVSTAKGGYVLTVRSRKMD